MPNNSIFISSTGKDLYEYRQAAIETCHKLGLRPIAMEFFEAMGVGATEGSRAKLRKSGGYVGIFAHRYGYIEPGHSQSVTELEFECAGECNLERLCFVVDPTHPWSPEAIDFQNHETLRRFVERIEQSLIRATFTTVDDFKSKLMHALVEFKERHPELGRAASNDAAPEAHVRWTPAAPPLMMGREADLIELKARLSAPGLTVMRGWPGVGKTTLVNALANSPEVLAAFPDGLLWAAVGESANPLAHLTRWAQDLGSSGAPKTVDEAQMSVRALLAKKRALLIVDDVWDPVTAAAFKVGGPQCSLLITTRMTDIARSIAATPAEVYVLGQLSDENAAQLFAQLAPQVAAQHPVEARRLVLELEGLPLAIRVAGRLLEAEARMGWGILNLLEEFAGLQRMLGETAPDDRFDQATGTVPTVSHLLKQSTDRLDSVTRDRYALLGAFAPKPATFDLDAMQAVWEAGDPLDARATARTLADRGLLEPIIGTGRFQVHALLVAHARSLLD